MTGLAVTREETSFTSEGKRCAAWLYRPAGGSLPIVVMAPGFSGERFFRLPDYAQRFAERGMAVLLFDYRHFGDSEGQPRQLVDHRRQHCDWLAAVEHAGKLDGIDPQRVGLWGTSYSGGHVIAVAARSPHVRVVVSQVPMLDVPHSARVKTRFVIAGLCHGIRDWCGARLGCQPHYIATVGPPNRFAAMNQPGCEAGYRAIVPPEINWQNRCTARSLLTSLSFRPGRVAHRVKCPTMILIAEHDQVIRCRVTRKWAARIPVGKILEYPIDHFQIYLGQWFEETSKLEADFLAEQLLPASAQGDG